MTAAKQIRNEIKQLEERIEDLRLRLDTSKEIEKKRKNKKQKDIKWRIEDKIKSGEGFTTIKGLCIYHGVCNATVYNWIKKGVIPRPIKIGGRVKGFKNSDLLEMEKSW